MCAFIRGTPAQLYETAHSRATLEHAAAGGIVRLTLGDFLRLPAAVHRGWVGNGWKVLIGFGVVVGAMGVYWADKI